ncbi:MAG: type II secretion system protein [Rickettsiales bacterium]
MASSPQMNLARQYTNPSKAPNLRHGFTLVELSIVIAVFGLIVGGVLVGKSMTRKAALRSVIVDFQTYKAAIRSFNEQYGYMPGDFPTATKIWGGQDGTTTEGTTAGCLAYTSASPATGIATCNGNGDGIINTNQAETFRAWQHLANAGLIEGRFSGVPGAAGVSAVVVGTNVPKSRIASGGWSFFYLGDYGDASWYTQKWGYVITFGANGAAENDYANNPLLIAQEAANIDTKLDDGKPNSGIVETWRTAANPNCVVAADNAYTLTSQTAACTMIFMLGY